MIVAKSQARQLLLVLAVLCSGCERSSDRYADLSSVTVRLPPARPQVSAPGFSRDLTDGEASLEAKPNAAL